MIAFTSRRERRLWFWAVAVVVAIYSTVGLAGTWAGVLRDRGLLESSFILAFLVTIVAVVGSAVRRSGRREVWVALGVSAVFAMIFVRMANAPEERTHLFEYGLLAVLIHQALTERSGSRVWRPAIASVVITSLLGWVDEGIQAFLPDRVYDIRDVGVNALAGLTAVGAGLLIARARRWDVFHRENAE